MFLPKPMRKANIFIREEDVAQVLVALARLEILDVAESEARAGWSGDESKHWSDLAKTYADQARRLEHLLQTLKIPQQEASPPERLEPAHDASNIEDTLKEISSVVQDWQARQTETEEEIKRLRLLLQSMRLLQPLDISVEAMRHLRYLNLSVGTLPRENLENLQIVLFRIPFMIIPVHEYDERVLVFAATDQDHAPILNRALSSIFMEPLELPRELTGSPAEVVDVLQQHLTEAERQLADLEQERERLVQKWRAQLLALWHQAHSDATVVETINQLSRHGEVYLITGWVPEQAVDQLLITIQNVTEGRAEVEVLEPIVREGTQVPSLLRNPSFLRPFESLVSTFGFPAYDEIDPTPLVALTFVLMYGMMFGDVGHGLLLALGGLWFWRRSQGEAASLGAVLMISGLSATFFGFLYGSLFGREDVLPHLWLNPLESISNILFASIAAGIVVLNVGFGLHLISAWRSRAWGQLLFSQKGAAGIWLYWALVGGALALWQGLSLPFTLWLLLVLIPMVLIFLHEPLGRLIGRERPLLEQNWGEYSIQSFFELFETIISHISNSLSFVRLGAFAVAHVGLSQVVFLLAGLTGGGMWQLPVIVLGTLLIVGFEGLIVGIQTLRLEYYEFFNKFFGGRGRNFVPLRLSKAVGPGEGS